MPTTFGVSKATIAATLPALQAKLAGLLKAQAQLAIKPPSLSASLEVAAKILASLQIAIEGPAVAINLSVIAKGVAELIALIGAISVQLKLLVGFAHANVAIYVVEDEKVSNIGSALGGALSGGLPAGGGPNDPGFAVAIACGADPATVALVKLLFAIV